MYGSQLVLPLLLLSLSGDRPPSGARDVRSAVEVELRAGASVRLESGEQTIVFEKVEGDSRCPKGVTCVWEGDAAVRLSIGPAGGTRTEFTLHTHTDAPREAVHHGFSIRLVAVQPYPTIDRQIDQSEYRVRLAVTRQKP